MAQLPTIASTSNRRLLPTAYLQIEGATPAAFGGAIGAGLQAVGEAGTQAAGALAQFELAKQQEAERLAEFDRQATFVEFGAAESTRLQEAQRNIEGPAQGFTKGFMGEFDTRAQQFLEKVPERFRDQWRAKMTTLRSGLSTDALRAEFAQRDAWSTTTLTQSLTSLQNGAAQTPDKLDEWRTQGLQLIESSLLSPQAKADASLKWRANVAVAAAQGDVLRDPEGAISRLGGIDHITAIEAADQVGSPTPGAYIGPSSGGSVQYTKSGAGRGLAGDIVQFFTGKGLPEHVARGIAAGIFAESRNNHGISNPDSGAFGLGQHLGARKNELLRRYGPNPTRQQQLEFLWWELKGGDHGGPSVLAGRNEGQVLDRYIKRFMRPAAGAETIGDIQRGMAALGYTASRAPARKGAAPAAAGAPAAAAPAPTAVAAAGGAPAAAGAQPDPASTTSIVHPTEAPPIDPRYADIPLDARMQLIDAANRELDRREQVDYTVEQKQHDDWLNQFMMDVEDGKAGRADIEAARSSGRITDFNEYSAAMNIVERREQKSAALDLYTAMTNGGAAFNPYDENATKAVDAAVAAQGGTPQAAFNVWQRTGILGKVGAVALRGAMVSTDERQVASAASIASNMLARNPNAFAGVEGGSDIERNALLYSHYVNDLGLSAQDAAKRVAQQNSPELRRRIDMSRDERADFRKRLKGQDVGNMLSNASGGWFSIDPEFTAPEQRAAAAQDYAEIADEHFAQHGDERAAQAYAMSQMKKLYGVVNGRLMKFPPTRAYPPVNGSQEYIFSQAAADIKRVTGRTIAPDNIYFMPLRGGATSEAFRTGKPVPYEIHYIDKGADGQRVYRMLQGRAFYADVGAAQRAGQEANRRAFKERRRQDQRAREIIRQRRGIGGILG